MCHRKPYLPPLFLSLTLCLFSSLSAEQTTPSNQAARMKRHEDPQWASIEKHLPDPATATPQNLEEEADLLRARRFPEDALDFYNFSLKRGENSANLLNKIGMTYLELHNTALAETYFRRAAKLDRRNGQIWNNLAAAEYIGHQNSRALSDYKHAVKLDKTNAVFHANLSTMYLGMKDYKSARKQAEIALNLDPLVFQKMGGTGTTAQVLSMEDRAEFAFEMAKLYAQRGDEEQMLHSLAVASENGFDVFEAMREDSALSKYKKDPRVIELVMTAKALRKDNAPSLTHTAPLSR